MRIAGRLAVLTSAVFAVTLLTASGAVASSDLGIEPSGAIRAVSEGRLTFSGEGLGVTCNTSLNGKMAPIVAKAAGALPEGLLGAIEEARFAECTDTVFRSAAEVRALLEALTRSELVYASFLGTLPNITGVLMNALEVAIQIRVLGITCLYRGSVGILVTFPAEGGGNRARFLESRVSLISGSETCPRTGTLTGSLRITPSQRLTLRAERLGPVEPTLESSTERGVKTELLTAGFGSPARVRAFIDVPTEGRVRVDSEARCRQWLWWRERCAVTITGVTSPASGEVVVEYISGVLPKELRIRYERL